MIEETKRASWWLAFLPGIAALITIGISWGENDTKIKTNERAIGELQTETRSLRQIQTDSAVQSQQIQQIYDQLEAQGKTLGKIADKLNEIH